MFEEVGTQRKYLEIQKIHAPMVGVAFVLRTANALICGHDSTKSNPAPVHAVSFADSAKMLSTKLGAAGGKSEDGAGRFFSFFLTQARQD